MPIIRNLKNCLLKVFRNTGEFVMKLAPCALLSALIVSALVTDASAQVVRTATGTDAAAIQSTVDAFRNDLGILNPNGVCDGITCLPGVGRREVNWDGVPDGTSSPNAFPGDFFNLASGNPAGRIRGIQFTTTGTMEVSADSDSDNDGNPGPLATLFGNRHPDNDDDFAAFSAERIFGLNGTNQLDVTFAVPGSPGERALVKGFGVVFTDVELAGSTVLEYYDANDVLIHTQPVPEFNIFGAPDSFGSFSFAGVSFSSAVVSRVHITNGGFDLALTQFGADDSVAMDDFIYGEPVLIPEPTSLLLACGAVMLAMTVKR
jgi:hypothetical protein